MGPLSYALPLWSRLSPGGLTRGHLGALVGAVLAVGCSNGPSAGSASSSAGTGASASLTSTVAAASGGASGPAAASAGMGSAATTRGASRGTGTSGASSIAGTVGGNTTGGLPDAGVAALRVLFIGDSYTYVNDLPGMLETIAQTSGVEPSIATGEVVQGGATLQVQWQNGIAQTVIPDGGWTHVVLQGQSLEPTRLAGDPPLFDEYAGMFGALATDAGARTVLLVTWARAAGDPSTYPILFDNPPEMQDDLTAGYDAVAAAIPGSLLACAGPAFREAITQHPEVALQQGDYSHPTVAGTYLAASTLYVALTGHPVPEASAVPAGLGAITATALRGIALLGSSCANAQLKGILRLQDQFGNGNVVYDGDGGPFEYGTAGTPIASTFYMTNWGGMTVDVTPRITLDPPFDWTGGSYPGGHGRTSVFNQFGIPYCSKSIAPNESCALSVTFDGTRSARGAIELGLTDAYTPTYSRWLQATAAPRALLSINVYPDLFNACEDEAICGTSFFAGTILGTSAPFGGSASTTLYVVNRGARPTTSLAGAPLAAPFSWGLPDAGGFPGGAGGVEYESDAGWYPYCSTQALAPGAWCAITAGFSPTDAGEVNATLKLEYSDALGPITPSADFELGGGGFQASDGGSPWWNDLRDGGDTCHSDAGCLPP